MSERAVTLDELLQRVFGDKRLGTEMQNWIIKHGHILDTKVDDDGDRLDSVEMRQSDYEAMMRDIGVLQPNEYLSDE
jgi:hypothetical protein